MTMSNVKNLLEKRQSKKVLTQWRRYADDFDKNVEDESEEDESDEFDFIDTDDEEDQDFIVRKPRKSAPRVQRQSVPVLRRTSSFSGRPKTLKLKRKRNCKQQMAL